MSEKEKESKKRGLYFKFLRNEQNEEIEYKYNPPVYGESNTDITFYEPNATRISNMYKSASAASKGVYDFDGSKKKIPNIEDCTVPLGRKLGLTFEEVSQLQTINNSKIKNQSDNIEKSEKDKTEQLKKEVGEVVNILNNSDSTKSE